MIGRLVQSGDFKRLLATPIRSRSAHFAVHHLAAGPSLPGRRSVHVSSTTLSTEPVQVNDEAVDNFADKHWLGSVIPKRHARRAVTRNLLRRQIRAALAERLDVLPPGLWLVRLRSPFAKEQFVSAASETLRAAARQELQQLFARISRPAMQPHAVAKAAAVSAGH